MTLIAILTVCYLAGSVNFSIIVFRLTGRGDPREAFSGNPGMTNVYRQCGFPMAALVLMPFHALGPMGGSIAWFLLKAAAAAGILWVAAMAARGKGRPLPAWQLVHDPVGGPVQVASGFPG